MPDQGPPINIRGDFPEKKNGKESWKRPKKPLSSSDPHCR